MDLIQSNHLPVKEKEKKKMSRVTNFKTLMLGHLNNSQSNNTKSISSKHEQEDCKVIDSSSGESDYLDLEAILSNEFLNLRGNHMSGMNNSPLLRDLESTISRRMSSQF